MSHTVTIATKVKDSVAIASACQRLGLAAPIQGAARLYSGEVDGLVVQLPGWQYPAVIDTATGNINYDNLEGAWGNQRELDKFLQAYAVEKVRLEARRQGFMIHEQALADGAIKVQVIEAG